jgi:chemotaxis protein methyltransferase CheR
MNAKTFDSLRRIVYEKSGISINEGKIALVTARIGKRMRALKLDEAEDYLEYLLTDNDGAEIIHLLDAISTNVTSFFREESHFEFLDDIFSKWLDEGHRKFRFWSAACSSGEEPYSVAMMLANRLNGINADIKILATDISTKILEKSIAGIYTEDKISSIPKQYRLRYMKEIMNCNKTSYKICDDIKNMIVFNRINLSKPPFPMHGPMDAVFCRNVMIYFDNTVRKKLLEDIYRLLKPDGYLFVGHAESLTGLLSGFKAVKPSIYIKS